MGIIFALLPLSVLLAVVALAGYFWGVRSGQFEDLETPAMRMLFDDDEIAKQKDADKKLSADKEKGPGETGPLV